MTDGERLEEIVEAAVARGDAPGVVAAVGRGDETYVAAAGVVAVGGPPMRPGACSGSPRSPRRSPRRVVLTGPGMACSGLDEPWKMAAAGTGWRAARRRWVDGPLTDMGQGRTKREDT